MSAFKTGYAEININPKLGIGISGYYVPRFASGILDDIMAQCLALTTGDTPILIISVDNCLIYTDIAKDGMMQGPNIEETKKLVDETNLKIVASGGVSSLEDLKALDAIKVHGAIIGKAIYTGAISLEEAVALFK